MGKLADTVPTTAPKRCTIGALLEHESTDADDRKAIAETVGNREISVDRVRTWLSVNGVAVSKDTVSRHREGKCLCARA